MKGALPNHRLHRLCNLFSSGFDITGEQEKKSLKTFTYSQLAVYLFIHLTNNFLRYYGRSNFENEVCPLILHCPMLMGGGSSVSGDETLSEVPYTC